MTAAECKLDFKLTTDTHTSPSCESYGVSITRIFNKNNSVIKASQCNSLELNIQWAHSLMKDTADLITGFTASWISPDFNNSQGRDFVNGESMPDTSDGPIWAINQFTFCSISTVLIFCLSLNNLHHLYYNKSNTIKSNSHTELSTNDILFVR